MRDRSSPGAPRVLYCTDTYPPQVNGVSVVTALSVAGLRARGWECAVVAPRYPTVLPHGPWENGEYGQGVPDPNFKVSNLQVNAAGTQLTFAVTVAAGVNKSKRYVLRVGTPNGDTGITAGSANVFQVN